jgi:hypothetical protein
VVALFTKFALFSSRKGERSMERAKAAFIKQMLDFFGRLPGQSPMQFAAEVKALSEQEKRDFAAMLTEAGYPCDAPATQVAA